MRHEMRRAVPLILAVLAAMTMVTSAATARTFSGHECFSRDIGRRLTACTELLAIPDLDAPTRAQAYSMRALAYSLIGRYPEAIADYDQAIAITPNFPVALNNRAWAKFRMDDIAGAWPDVQKSLKLDPWSPHAHDTRAHLYHRDGKAENALRDYKIAMRLGGAKMVKLYQCGLQAEGHYLGPLSGIVNDQLLSGLKACTEDRTCDPLPPDEECKAATS